MSGEYEDYTNDPEYLAFVEELAGKCTCTPSSLRPCDGLLAGGFCDDLHFDGEEDDVLHDIYEDDA